MASSASFAVRLIGLYASDGTLNEITEVSLAVPVPFGSSATGRALHDRKADLWDNFYHLRRETFLEHNHRRAVVESTIWMIKAKFDEAKPSKTDTAQVNELLRKVLCHNLCVLIQSMYELGILVDFGASA